MKKRVILEKSVEERAPNDVEELLQGIRVVLQRTGRKRFTVGEKEKILGVVKALVQ